MTILETRSTALITTEAEKVAKLVEALEGLLAIVDESDGVSGYFLYGDIAEWSMFEGVEMAKEALATYRQKEFLK